MGLSGEWLLQKRLVGDAKIVFDVGASIGRVTARYLELFPKATVYAFEPAPANVKKFRERLPGLAGGDRVRLIPKAVLDMNGEAEIQLYENRDHHSVLKSTADFRNRKQKPGKVIETTWVPCVKLDAFCRRESIERVDVLKIDTEGAEKLVLKGAWRLLTEKRIHLIYAELPFWFYRIEQTRPWEVLKYLEHFGYYLHSLQAQHHDKDGRLLDADGIFLRR